ncbi:DUF805 domain-containing protein [Novosphingobium lentum]|uniref:DUF805 domain-containing protein n=1 Tax=Novosphingobium lentum TaxID=145287 RepID=UPI000831DB58|nr:DUF805 domain-containing protein [Novosphingobium lentum]
MEWMLLPYRRYFEFTGRSRRKEYWMFVLFSILVQIAIGIVFGRTTTTTYGPTGIGGGFYTSLTGGGNIVSSLFSLANFIPSLAVAVRRLHDQDKSGWLMLLVFIPLLGWIALLVLMCLEGTRGPNRFGDDPKGVGGAAVFE